MTYEVEKTIGESFNVNAINTIMISRGGDIKSEGRGNGNMVATMGRRERWGGRDGEVERQGRKRGRGRRSKCEEVRKRREAEEIE